MSYKFAFLEGDLFAAIAPISGFSKRLNMTSVPKKGPVSLLHIHGLKDKILPPDGEGVPRRFFNTQEVIDYYIVHNKTYKTPEVLIDTKDINSKIWKAEGADGKDIQYIQVKNGVHEWFTARNSGKFNVIEYIWEFFENHPKN